MFSSILPFIVNSPVVEWDALAPIIVIMGAAVLGTLVEALPSAKVRYGINATLMILSLIVALALVVWRFQTLGETGGRQIAMGTMVEDQLSLVFQGILLAVALLAALVVLGRATPGDGSFAPQPADMPGSPQEDYAVKTRYQRTEMFILMLFSTGGMMAFIAAGNLLMLFVALEVMSLPLYVMSAMGRRRRLLSQEAGFKYFLLGAYASGFFLMGIALIYGFTGTLGIYSITQIATVAPGLDWMLLVGVAMLLVGLFFKVSAVPFHAWAPDVYQGAPSPIAGFMAAGVKVAAFGILVRLSMTLFGLLSWDLSVLLWVVIIATIVVGTFLGIVQTDVKRMLAYSSIAHVGFILVALIGLSVGAAAAVEFYVLTYGVATIGAFGLISIVRDADADGTVRGEASRLEAWDGLGKRHPALAGAMAIFLLSFAGIPLTGGFIGKFLVFKEGLSLGGGALVLVGLIASIVTAFFYFRLILRMYFTEPGENTATITSTDPGDTLVKFVVIVCAVATVALGLVAQPVLGLFAAVA